MYILVLVTASSKSEAERIANQLITKRLAACVNILGPADSLFWWKAKVDKAREFVLLIKSKRALFKEVKELVKRLHSYEVPEIIALPIIAGEKKYLDWIDEYLG